MIKKAMLGALAALSIGCYNASPAEEEAVTCKRIDAAAAVEERQENPAEEHNNDDIERFFAQCHDGRYDFDTRCTDLSQGYLDNITNSVYIIERIGRFKQSGRQEELKSKCASVLLDNGIVLTAKHCARFRKLDILGIKYDMEINLMHGGKRYPLEILVEGATDFAVLEMKKPAELPFLPYALGDTSTLEAGNITYMTGYVDREYSMIREGIVTRMEHNDQGWGEGYFLISNGIHFGDSGGATIGFRDGVPELIGINCYKHEEHDHAGGVLRIDMIRNEILARYIFAAQITLRP